MRAIFTTVAVALAVPIAVRPAVAWAQDDPAAQLEAIEQSLTTAGRSFRDKDFAAAQEALDEAKAALETLTAGALPDALRPQVEAIEQRLTKAERALARQSVSSAKSSASKKKGADQATTSRAAKSKKTAKTSKSNKAGNANEPALPPPSFMTDVAPILLGRCGNCHVVNTQGGLSMSSYAALAKGSRNGPIIAPGASQASRLVEVIFSGTMPRGGGQVSADELAVISRWIDAGARFDGDDPTAPLGQQRQAAAFNGPAGNNRPQSVEFMRDVAPLVVEHCLDCHSGEMPSGQLRLETLAAMLAGGKSGRILEPGRPRDSLVLKRLRGLDGDRMPKDKPALSSQQIARVEAWVSGGAKFDRAAAELPLKKAVEKLLERRLSHDELAAKRAEQAREIWATVAPGESTPRETDNFLLLGNVSAKRLDEVGRLAEAERAKIVKLLKLDSDAPLVKGRLVLFVLEQATDYATFVQQVEGREAASGTSGHVYCQESKLYSVFVLPRSSEALPPLVAEQVAAGFLRGQSDVPAWFAAGAGRTIAARVEPKSPLVKKWNAEAQDAAADDDPSTMMDAEVLDAEALVSSFAFVRALTQKLPQFQSLIGALVDGHDFDQSLIDTYRRDARALFEQWRRRQPAKKG